MSQPEFPASLVEVKVHRYLVQLYADDGKPALLSPRSARELAQQLQAAALEAEQNMLHLAIQASQVPPAPPRKARPLSQAPARPREQRS